MVDCECHLLDWSGGPLTIKYIKTGKICPLKDGISCQDKFMLGIIKLPQYKRICKYIPGKSGTKLPSTFIVSPASPIYG